MDAGDARVHASKDTVGARADKVDARWNGARPYLQNTLLASFSFGDPFDQKWQGPQNQGYRIYGLPDNALQ